MYFVTLLDLIQMKNDTRQSQLVRFSGNLQECVLQTYLFPQQYNN